MNLRILLAILAISCSATPRTTHAAPDQFLAKIYTEALGRVPDQIGWAGYASYLSGPCTQAKLKTVGVGLFTSSEYLNLGYSNAEKLLTLYRGAFSREPDLSAYNLWLGLMNGGMAWVDVVDSFFASTEFFSLAPTICANWYPWGNGIAIDMPSGGTGFTGTQAQLQALLNGAPPGGSVSLAQSTVVRLTSTLTIPAGVTLTTVGGPTPTHYARMGRLVSSASFSSEIVKISSGAKLQNVWVDGQRGGSSNYVRDQVNILVDGNSNSSSVRHVRTSNSRGWSSLLLIGTHETAFGCNNALVEYNLITAYSSSHYDGLWTDGITNACDDAEIRYNQIVDASDVAIVVFRATPGVQVSQVYGNTILNAGNSAFGGMDFDTHFDTTGNSFAGASIRQNTLWTGEAHYHIALSVGTLAWFPGGQLGTGAEMKDNTTGILSLNANVGIGVDGMLNATVTGNSLNTNLQSVSSCYLAHIVADISGAHASGTIQGPYVDTGLHGCI